MDTCTSSGRRSAKRCKIAGIVSYGNEPVEFIGDNKEKMIFRINDFADLEEKREEYITTETIQACGQLWYLWIYPRGNSQTAADVEHVSIFLDYAGENPISNPVVAKSVFRTRTIVHDVSKHKFSKGDLSWGIIDFGKREDLIRKDCDKNGTLTIEVEIEVATEVVTKKQSVWSPILDNSNFGTMLKRSIEETFDVTFVVGPSKIEIKAHKCILAIRARDLYELIGTSSSNNSGTTIVLRDTDVNAFQALMDFVYLNAIPEWADDENDGDDDNEEKAKSILVVANRYGCTTLKLWIESYLIRNVLRPSKGPRLLLLADSHSCALLKEECMNAYTKDSQSFLESNTKDVNQLKESNDLLMELLAYRRKKYSSVEDDGDGTIFGADDYDVTSLRERLEKYDLDLDGSREMLLKRWRDFRIGQRRKSKRVKKRK